MTMRVWGGWDDLQTRVERGVRAVAPMHRGVAVSVGPVEPGSAVREAGVEPAESGACVEPSSSRWAWVVLVASVLAIAVAVPLYRARSSTRTIVTTVTVPPSAAMVRECDVGVAQCAVVDVPGSVIAAVSRRFPGSSVLDSYGVASAGRVDARYVQVRTSTGVVVVVQSHCAGAGVLPDREYGDLRGRGPARGVVVVGGAAGCSVAVTLDVPRGVIVPVAAARALARDPLLMLAS